jgi:hypothetical protein
MKQEELAKRYLKERDFTFQEGFVINTQEMNPNNYDEIMFEGKTIDEAIDGYFRKTAWWSYEPSNGEQIFEDIWEAVDYAEDFSEISFDKFKELNNKKEK